MSWYLKRVDGEVYGPVGLLTLQLWAMDGRVAPGDMISVDQKKWAPAFDLAELSMEWKVELRDGSAYGPIHLLAMRDLIHDGSVSLRAKIKHKQSGEEAIACEALLIDLLKTESKGQSAVAALTDQLGEAEKRIEKLQQDLQNASGIENKLRDEIKSLTATQKVIVPAAGAPAAQVQDLREQVDKWKKLYEEEHAAAAAREAELQHQLREQKSGADQHHKLVQEVETWKKMHESGVDQHHKLVQEVETWKKMHERDVAQIEQMKSRQPVGPPAGSDMVPRARLEDAERKFSQTKRNYQQLLKTLNRSLGARSVGRPIPQADNLQRRDIS